MASTIKLKRSTTAGSVPSLSEGEVAVNLKDKILYVANSTVTFELARNTANNGLVLHDGSGNEITVTAPALGSDYSLVLPPNDGDADQFLQTDGSGTLVWADPVGSGDVNKVGTPVDNQLAIWTSSTQIEGNTNVTFDPTGSGTFTLGSSVDLSVGGNATITGDLTVNGTTTTLDVTTVAIEDPIVKFANNNTADTTDIGFYGEYNKSTTVKYAAFFRDTTDKSWKVYNDLSNEPIIAGGDIDLTGGSLAQLDAVIDGGTY